MGNSGSNASHRPNNIPNRSQQSPTRRDSHQPSGTPPTNQPHRSLRTKKKSLELPDLASLALTPSNQHQNSVLSPHLPSYRRSTPIPIPVSPNINPNGEPRSRPQNNFTSSQAIPDILVDEPSTHIPIPPHHRPRGNPYIRGAPIQYNSTRSFTNASSQQRPEARMRDVPPAFVPETVYSTIPLALRKAEQELAKEFGKVDDYDTMLQERKDSAGDELQEPILVKISWHGGGKTAVLARAADDNWKGRQPMERESPTSDTFTISVALVPGTHHIKFLIDDQWRVADDLPTAVDDEGSLANYIAVPYVARPPTPQAKPTSLPAAPVQKPMPGQSFWSTSSMGNGSVSEPTSSGDHRSAQWTSVFPPELLSAAKEEEAYLANSSSSSSTQSGFVPAPNIPPAPALPRHLDKLILNVRPGAGGASGSNNAGGSSFRSGRDRDRDSGDRRTGRKGRSLLGLTSHTPASPTSGPSQEPRIPVTTASGTDISTTRLPRIRLDVGPGVADDASVLPVPSHVVLHHLSTSAIRNGVLAVGNTTRYKKKYLTTIYYKPT